MLKNELSKKIKELTGVEASIEIPKEKKFGDYSSNVAMVLAKKQKKNPMEIAENLKSQISRSDGAFKVKSDYLDKVEVVPPGFLNFYLKPEWLDSQIPEIINQGEKYGSSDQGKNKKLMVEFISANPTGPLTIGNSRGGIIGDVLANIYQKTGWGVTREYYFNDAGGQIDVLGHSIVGDEETQYQGNYIAELRKKIKTKDYKQAGKEAAQIMIEEIKKTVDKMGIKFDSWFAEGKDIREQGKVEEIIKWLKDKNLAYEKDGAIWFKSTQFGDDKDRVLIKSTGEPTYFGVDCAYHKNKFVDRKFDKVINIWGADHHGDLARLKGFVKALGYEKNFEIIIQQFVRLVKDGKEVRMSKRAGNFILVEDLLKEIPLDVFRYFMLNYSANAHLDFDLKLAKEQSQKNPVYYIQYVGARIHGILAKLKAKSSRLSGAFKLKTSTESLKLLREKEEIDLIKELIKLPEIIEDVAETYQVQKLPQYALELAKSFHNFYEKCWVIEKDNPDLTSARLSLVKATQIVLKNTLDLMGISMPEKM